MHDASGTVDAASRLSPGGTGKEMRSSARVYLLYPPIPFVSPSHQSARVLTCRRLRRAEDSTSPDQASNGCPLFDSCRTGTNFLDVANKVAAENGTITERVAIKGLDCRNLISYAWLREKPVPKQNGLTICGVLSNVRHLD